MNAKTDGIVCVVLYGSHLFGTATEASDVDLKIVFAPALRELLLRTNAYHPSPINDVLLRHRVEWSGKRVEQEFIPLHEFVRLAVGGQTMALDMLHAPSGHTLVTSAIWSDLLTNRQRCLSKNMNAFMGYARNQAFKYAAKGDRLEVLERFRGTLRALPPAATLAERWSELEAGPYVGSPHVRYLPATEESSMQRIVEVCGRKLMEGVTVQYALQVVDDIAAKYGKRARRAMEEQGADWKALSHAIRVIDEVLRIAGFGRIDFPLPEAAHLLDIKNGQLPAAAVLDELNSKFEQATRAVRESSLPEAVDRDWWERWLLATLVSHHRLQGLELG
jgi:hypothetical protein